MASITVSKLGKDAQNLVEKAKTSRESAPAKIAERFGPVLREGETVPDTAFFLELCLRLVEHEDSLLQVAEAAHISELGDDVEIRKKVEEAGNSLFASVVQCREVGESVIGPDFSSRLGLTGSTPYDLQLLSQSAEAAARSLREQSFEPAAPGLTFDSQYWATRLENGVKALDVALGEKGRELREASDTLKAKNEALGRLDETISAVAAAVKGLSLLAGDQALADSMRRPSRRSSSRRKAEADSGKPVSGTTPPANPA